MRVTLLCITLVVGIAAIVLALLMPAHLRATDPHVIAKVGANGTSLVQLAADAASHNPAVAKLLLACAESLKLPGTDRVVDELRSGARARSRSRTVLEELEAQEAGRIQVSETPVFTAIRKSANREKLIRSLQSIEAKSLLRNRSLTNLSIFAPVESAAGLPLDVSIATTAFLLEQRAFPPSAPLRDQILRYSGPGDPALEELYLSIFALARRFSSEQMIGLVANVPNVSALHTLTRFIQEHPDSGALVFSLVYASREGGAVAAYLDEYSKTGQQDLTFALRSGVGGLDRLLDDQQPVYHSSIYDAVTGNSTVQSLLRPFVNMASSSPLIAIALKFSLLALGALMLATSARFRKPHPLDESYVFVPKFSLIRRGAFAAVFLLLAIIIGEPYLAQGDQKAPPIRFTSPILGNAAATPPLPVIVQKSTPMLDLHTLLAILTFIVTQGAIYAVCVAKLAEIRKQPVPTSTKLKLLDNEDNLFDGGLYAGLFGTAASLILLTLGVIKPSLVSAYSSTLFGILSVAILKIGHVRPLKRRLLLESAKEPETKIVTTPEGGASAPLRNPFA